MEMKFKIWVIPCNFYKLYTTENVTLYPPKDLYEWLYLTGTWNNQISWVLKLNINDTIIIEY